MGEPSGATSWSSAPLVAAAGAALLLIASITAIHLTTREAAEARPLEPIPRRAEAAPVESGVPRRLVPGAAGAVTPSVAAAPRKASSSTAADDAAGARAAPELRASQPSGLQVLFRLDPRLSRGSHLGTRWVSPATHTGRGDGSLYTVQARVRRRGSDAPASAPEWLAAEPDMVAVTPERGSDVEIVVLREGRSTLTVTDGGASSTLVVNAARRAGTWRVDISQ